MKSAYIFHDAFCDPMSDWYPWMKTHLESQGYFVVVPAFPTPAGQSLASWKAAMRNYEDKFDNETIFIGHGTGAIFALRVLEQSSAKIAGLFLVTPYAEPIGHAGYDRVNESFTKDLFDWPSIASKSFAIECFAGSDDPFVPLAKSQALADSLSAPLHVIPDGGHLNRASGFTQAVVIAQGIKDRLGQLDKDIELEKEEAENATMPEPQPVPEPEPFPAGPSLEGVPKPTGPNPNLVTHTMYQDMSTLVNSNTGKVASSLLGKAREDEEVRKSRSPLSSKNIMYIAGSALFGVAIIGITLFLLNMYAPAARQAATPDLPSLFPSDVHARIEVRTSEPSYEIADRIEAELSKPFESGTIKDIYYVTNGARTPFGTLIKSLDITTAPAGFAEQVPTPTLNEPTFMHGAVMLGNTQSEFLALRVSQYDTAFSLIRSWEPTLFRDLGIIFYVPEQYLRTQTTRGTFTDETVSNRTIRVLRYKAPLGADPLDDAPDSAESTLSPYDEGDVMLAYFFLNERTLVIVDSLEEIPAIIARWANSQVY